GDRITMRVRERANMVSFHLDVKILYAKCVDVFCTKLYTPFIDPRPIVLFHFAKDKFIYLQLAIELEGMGNICFYIQSYQRIIKTPVLLLKGTIKNNRVQITKFKMIRSSKNNALKQSNV